MTDIITKEWCQSHKACWLDDDYVQKGLPLTVKQVFEHKTIRVEDKQWFIVRYMSADMAAAYVRYCVDVANACTPTGKRQFELALAFKGEMEHTPQGYDSATYYAALATSGRSGYVKKQEEFINKAKEMLGV